MSCLVSSTTKWAERWIRAPLRFNHKSKLQLHVTVLCGYWTRWRRGFIFINHVRGAKSIATRRCPQIASAHKMQINARPTDLYIYEHSHFYGRSAVGFAARERARASHYGGGMRCASAAAGEIHVGRRGKMRASCLRCHSHESNKGARCWQPPVSLFAHCFVWLLFKWNKI